MTASRSEAVIRKIRVEDAEEAARLCGELGYPVSAAEMKERIQSRRNRGGGAVYVACRDGQTIGWIDVGIVHHLQSGAYGEIGGLVVSSGCRSQGVGARLVQRAEEWIRGRGLSRVVVRSRVSREAAHRFYLRAGYQKTKTAAVFKKNL